MGPKGAKGDSGDAGPPGATGDNGEPGDVGPPGGDDDYAGDDSDSGVLPATCVASTPSQIATCLENLPEPGSSVLVRAGRYVLTSEIHIARSNVELYGEGTGTVLQIGNEMRCAAIIIGDKKNQPDFSVENVRVHDLQIDGNRDKQHPEDATWETYALEPHLRLKGITIRNGKGVSISNVLIANARSGALVTERGVTDLSVSDVRARCSYYDGFAFYETTGSIIEGNVLEDNDHSGLSLDISFDQNILGKNQILRNGKTACGSHPNYTGNHPGIYIAAGHGNLFSSNIVAQSGGDGILLTQRSASLATERCAQRNLFYSTEILQNGGVGVPAPDAECRVLVDPLNAAAGENEVNYNRAFGSCYRLNGGQVYGSNGFLDFQVVCGQ